MITVTTIIAHGLKVVLNRFQVLRAFALSSTRPSYRAGKIRLPLVMAPRFIHVSLILASPFFMVVCAATVTAGMLQTPNQPQTPPMIPTKIREVKTRKEPVPFYDALTKALKKRKAKLETLCPNSDNVARRILEEYGAMFVATKKVLPPPV